VLKLTPLDRFVMPLPLSLTQFAAASFIKNFTFSEKYVFFVDGLGRLQVLEYTFPATLTPVTLLGDPAHNWGHFPRNFVAIPTSRGQYSLSFYSTVVEEEETQHRLTKLTITVSQTGFSVTSTEDLPIEAGHNVEKVFGFGIGLFVLRDRCVLERLDLNKGEFELVNELELQENEQVKTIRVFQKPGANGDFGCVYLTDKDNLFLDGRLISSDCTSFRLTATHLLYTVASQTVYDVLHVYPLSFVSSRAFSGRPQQVTKELNWYLRNVEKGSLLVVVSGSKVVFRLPRGNFETIAHRLLNLEALRTFVAAGNYHAAFLLARKHKLNFNLLVDMDAKKWVEAVKSQSFFRNLSSEFVDLFVLGLSDEVSDELRYLCSEAELAQLHASVTTLVAGDLEAQGSKLNFCCRTLLATMKTDEAKYIYNVLVVYSKSNPPRLADGLRLIKQVKDRSGNQNAPRKPPHLVMSSQPQPNTLHFKDLLKYFCWLVSAEALYRLALSLYDLDLAVMIAEFTHMDPKDYLPYIETLRAIPRPLDFRFRICCDLKLYQNAIQTAAEGEPADHEKALDLIRTHRLFLDGLEVFGSHPAMHKLISKEWVAHLLSKKDFKQALALFVLEEGNTDSVVECCQKVMDWKAGYRYLKAWDPARLEAYLGWMRQELVKLKAFGEAGKVARKLKESPNRVCGLFVKGRLFKKVKEALAGTKLSEAETAELKADLAVAASIETNALRQQAKDLSYWTVRLETVQKVKANPEAAEEGGELNDAASFQSKDSVVSAGSDSSKVSRFTGMSLHFKSKNKKPKNLLGRKHKEGALYEEEWLVEAVNDAALPENQLKNMAHLSSLLVAFGLMTEFRELRGELRRLVELLTKKGVRRTLDQQAFEKGHPEIFELYNHLAEFQKVVSPPDFRGEKEAIRKLDFE